MSTQQQKFGDTVASLYETVLDASHWDTAIRNVATLFRSPKACMFRYDFATLRPSEFRHFGHDPDAEGMYAAYYYQLDPGQRVGMYAEVGQWLADETMLDLNSWDQQEYARDFALRYGIGRVAGCKVANDDSSCVYLSLARRPGAPRFGESARRLHQELQPHLLRVTRMQARIDRLATGHALARACLDRLSAGVLVVDKARRVHLINAHGTQLLGVGGDLAIRNLRLFCKRPALDEQLGCVVSDACGQPSRGGALRICRDSQGAGLLLMILPIPASHDLAGILAEPLALVVIGDPNASAQLAETYRALFSISRAEAALLEALVRGTTAVEWAQHRGISIATVRTQLRSLFDKTGVDSQSKLVGLAKSVPPMLDPP